MNTLSVDKTVRTVILRSLVPGVFCAGKKKSFTFSCFLYWYTYICDDITLHTYTLFYYFF